MSVKHTIQGINFEWDSHKALINQKKHGVTFESACEIFFDPFLQPNKEEVIDQELRETVIGMTKNWQLLFVAYTLRHEVIRQQRITYENQ